MDMLQFIERVFETSGRLWDETQAVNEGNHRGDCVRRQPQGSSRWPLAPGSS